MDYEKKYNEAIKRAKQHCADYVVETIFPELKESEDEKIRKELIEALKQLDREKCPVDTYHYQDWIDWLEKQGEHAKFCDPIQVGDKVTRNEDGVLVNLSQLNRVAKKQGVQKPVDIVPIYRVGDVLKKKGKDYTFTVDRIQGGFYHCDRNHGAFFPIEEQGNWELVEQKPVDKVEPKKEDTSELTPFEAELFSMMSDAWQGYQLGEEVNIAEIVKEHSSELLERANKQKPAWSEEDENHVKSILSTIECCKAQFPNAQAVVEAYNADIEWLKSLKERIQPQPKQEWSEEDERNASYICAALDCYYRLREDRNNTNGQEDLDKARNWLYNKLKSLRPQINVTDEELAQAKKGAYNDALDKIEYHSGEPTFDDGWSAAIWYLKKRNAQPQNTWKPSDEQMEAMQKALFDLCGKDEHNIITGLYYDLKKLMEG